MTIAYTKPSNWWAHDRSPGQLLCHVEWTGDSETLASLDHNPLVWSNMGFRVTIDRADPVIWISAGMVSWAATGEAHPRVELTPPPGWGEPDNHYWIGSVIRFHADNRDVLYQLTSWHGNLTYWSPENIDRVDLGYYVAEWPD